MTGRPTHTTGRPTNTTGVPTSMTCEPTNTPSGPTENSAGPTNIPTLTYQNKRKTPQQTICISFTIKTYILAISVQCELIALISVATFLN